jgi:hypothetical protein
MNQITKKQFMTLHKAKSITGIAACAVTKEQMSELIAKCLLNGDKLPEFPTSRIDLNKHDTCYQDDQYLFVESVNPAEWLTQTIAYKLK